MLISKAKLSRLRGLIQSSNNRKLTTIIRDANGADVNFTNGTSEYLLSGAIKNASRVKRVSTRTRKSLRITLSREAAAILNNPVLEPNQLIPVIKPPKPDPSPSPQPSPSPTPSGGGDSGGGGISPTFLVNVAGSQITFGGTATGRISLTGPAGSTSTFARQGVTQTTSATPLNAYTITLSTTNNDLDASAYASGISVAGSTAGDVIQGSLQADIINGGDDNDTVSGNNGNDTITGGIGADNLGGGNNNDIFLYADEAELEDGTSLVDSAINGGDGTDRISVAGGLSITNTVSFAHATSIEELYVTGTAASNIALDATAEAAGINTVNISNATADSTVDVSEFTATGVSVTAGTANDNLIGGGAADTIAGGDGADTIAGGAGADNINGGNNNDFLSFATPAQLAEDATVDGGSGTDTISIDSPVAILNAADFARVINIESLIFQGGGGKSVTLGSQTDTAFASGIEIAITNPFANLTVNGALSNVAIRATGNNLFDDLTGGNSSDTITGAGGADTLTGGSGNDDFVYAAVSNSAASVSANNTISFDRITDFSAGADNLNIAAINTALTGGAAGTSVTVSTLTTAGGSLADTTIATFAELATAVGTLNGNTGWTASAAGGVIQAYLINLSGNTGGLGTGSYLVVNNNDTALTASDLMIAWTGTSQTPVGGTDFILA